MCFISNQDYQNFYAVMGSNKEKLNELLDLFEVDGAEALRQMREFTIEHNIYIGMLQHRQYLKEKLTERYENERRNN